MASTFSPNIHGRPHVDARLFLRTLLSRAHRLRACSDHRLRVPGAEWLEMKSGRLIAGGRTWVQGLHLRHRAASLRARSKALAESEVGSVLFFLALILATFLI